MDGKSWDLKTRLYVASLVILAAGLCAALLISLVVPADSESADAYVLANGVAYPVDPTQTKIYVHELRHFGGKAAVLFDDIDRWFEHLWRGRALARTVAWISGFVSLAIFLFARWLPGPDRRLEEDIHDTDR
jgi:hypothetical protein